MAFRPAEEPGSGSHCLHTMGPAGTCECRGPRLVGPDLDPDQPPIVPSTFSRPPQLALARKVDSCAQGLEHQGGAGGEQSRRAVVGVPCSPGRLTGGQEGADQQGQEG